MKTENLTQARQKLCETASKNSMIKLLTPDLHYKDVE